MNSERMLWIAVMQTYFVDAAQSRSLEKEEREKVFGSIWREVHTDHCYDICDFVGVSHKKFLKHLIKCYTTGRYKEIDVTTCNSEEEQVG